MAGLAYQHVTLTGERRVSHLKLISKVILWAEPVIDKSFENYDQVKSYSAMINSICTLSWNVAESTHRPQCKISKETKREHYFLLDKRVCNKALTNSYTRQLRKILSFDNKIIVILMTEAIKRVKMLGIQMCKGFNLFRHEMRIYLNPKLW